MLREKDKGVVDGRLGQSQLAKLNKGLEYIWFCIAGESRQLGFYIVSSHQVL